MNDSTQASIKLVIFDLGGTVVDHGCQAPVVAVIQAFEQLGIEVSATDARGPMGLAKLDHIRELFELDAVTAQWSTRYERDWTEEDVVATYERFLPLQTTIAQQHTDLIPGTEACFRYLRERDVAIGATTGYPRSVSAPILAALEQAGLRFDANICADEAPAGRPAPHMIHHIMARLAIESPQSVVNIGDTVPDMLAASNASVWAVGITETGSEFGLTASELASLTNDERKARHDQAAAKLRDAGAHAIVESPEGLPQLLESSDFRT